jgi:hypothetical protein
VWWHRLTANRETHALEMIGSIPSATLRNSSVHTLNIFMNDLVKAETSRIQLVQKKYPAYVNDQII